MKTLLQIDLNEKELKDWEEIIHLILEKTKSRSNNLIKKTVSQINSIDRFLSSNNFLDENLLLLIKKLDKCEKLYDLIYGNSKSDFLNKKKELLLGKNQIEIETNELTQEEEKLKKIIKNQINLKDPYLNNLQKISKNINVLLEKLKDLKKITEILEKKKIENIKNLTYNNLYIESENQYKKLDEYKILDSCRKIYYEIIHSEIIENNDCFLESESKFLELLSFLIYIKQAMKKENEKSVLEQFKFCKELKIKNKIIDIFHNNSKETNKEIDKQILRLTLLPKFQTIHIFDLLNCDEPCKYEVITPVKKFLNLIYKVKPENISKILQGFSFIKNYYENELNNIKFEKNSKNLSEFSNLSIKYSSR